MLFYQTESFTVTPCSCYFPKKTLPL